MKKASVPAFLQVIAVILFSFLLIVFTAQQIGSGLFAQKAIERSSLIYTLSTAANALSVMDEGYITKELTQKYDIWVGRKQNGDNVNYYMVVEALDALGQDDLVFSHEQGICGREGTPLITQENGEIAFRGKLGVPNPCYRLETELEMDGKEITLTIIPKKIKDMECQECQGSVSYSGRVVNLSPGTYTMEIWRKYQYMDEQDEMLAEEEVDVDYTADVIDDEKRFYLLTTEVEPTVIRSAECVRVVKTPDSAVTFEKCIKDVTGEDNQ